MSLRRWLYMWVVIVASGLVRWLSIQLGYFSDWLSSRPDWQQQVIVGLLLILIPAAFVYLWKGVRRLVGLAKRRRDNALALKIERAEANRRKIGFAEALVAEDRALAEMRRIVPVIVSVMSAGVQRQEAIKKQQLQLDTNSPQARQRFNQGWIDHARNLRRTTSRLRKEVGPLRKSATTLRECIERYEEWRSGKESPPSKWIEGYDTFVGFRQRVNQLIPTFMNAESRWDDKVRAMHRDLNEAVTDYAGVCNDYAAAFRELEAFCAIVIDAVDEWRRRQNWLKRILASVWRKAIRLT